MFNDFLLKILPDNLKEDLLIDENALKNIREIRLRIGKKPIAVCYGKEIVGNYDVTEKLIGRILSLATSYSVYAFESNISKGYLTIKGGHRIGVGGQVIWEDGRVKNFSHITFLCIRVARQIPGCADYIMDKFFSDELRHTIIISPAGFGKTTILRDVVKQISDKRHMNVSLIDERSEIAACINGVPQNDIGMRTDVIDGCEKSVAVYMAVRALSPQVIAMDEIGGKADVAAIRYSMKSGCIVIGTAHGTGIDDTDKELKNLFGEGGFTRAVILKKCGEVGECLDLLEDC